LDPEDVNPEPEVLGHLLLVAGLVAPTKFDPALFGPLNAALIDADPTIRWFGVLSVAFACWPEFRNSLGFMARTDPVTAIREEAAAVYTMCYEEAADS